VRGAEPPEKTASHQLISKCRAPGDLFGRVGGPLESPRNVFEVCVYERLPGDPLESRDTIDQNGKDGARECAVDIVKSVLSDRNPSGPCVNGCVLDGNGGKRDLIHATNNFSCRNDEPMRSKRNYDVLKCRPCSFMHSSFRNTLYEGHTLRTERSRRSTRFAEWKPQTGGWSERIEC
jgi:hypothetical protein